MTSPMGPNASPAAGDAMTTRVRAPIVGNVWKVLVEHGAKVDAGALLVVLETMKMEIPVTSPARGTVLEVVAPGQLVQEADVVAVLAEEASEPR